MLKRVYIKLCSFMQTKLIAIILTISFLFSLMPICYLSFFNRASGDDYGYGTLTHRAWLTTQSMIEVLLAAIQTIQQYYYSWQGTWFSIFVFSMQPEVFSDKAYVIVVFIMLFFWIGSTIILLQYVLVKRLKFSKWQTLLMEVLFLFISIQFIPSTKSSIFWFNGAAHYMLPFAMCQLLIYCLLRFAEGFQKRYFCFIIILMTLLGGSNYQAALLALLVGVYVMLGKYLVSKQKKVFWLLLPIAMSLTGLIISMKAPGNKVRGGEKFGFSLMHVIETMGACFLNGLQDIVGYANEKPLVIIGLLLIFVFSLVVWLSIENPIQVRCSVVVAGWSIYFAMQAPAAYAAVGVSRGVLNTNFQIFILVSLLTIVYLTSKVTGISALKNIGETRIRTVIVIPVLIFCGIMLIICRSNIKDATTWKCMEYIVTGQADDYKEQMELQTVLLSNTDVSDVILPYINDEQGPFMHMPVTKDQEAWTNKVTADFYGKDSVVAMPRPEWEMLYLK